MGGGNCPPSHGDTADEEDHGEVGRSAICRLFPLPLRSAPMPDPARKRLPTDTDDGMLLIISGPSGVGKTTITRAVERSIPGAVFSVSATTRPRRPTDVEGVDYHFVDDPTFQKM